MIRKIIIISVLAVGLVLLLIFRPWESNETKNPRFIDRLPDAEIIGKADLLYLTDLLSKNLYYYNSPLRDFISSDFVLSQGKDYGLDVQKPAYFFINTGSKPEVLDIGVMIMVKDSTKLGQGIARIKNVANIKDTLIGGYKFLINNKKKVHVTYGKDWLLFYMGGNGNAIFQHIINAGKNEITPTWSAFINNLEYRNSKFIAESHSKRLQDRGIQSAKLSLENDSTTISILAELKPYDSVSIRVRDHGVQMKEKEFTKTLINIHIDPSEIKRSSLDPVYLFMKEMGAKISFPVDDFLDAWDGNLAVRQGGYYTIQESYIESEFDDDFNVVEVVKSHNVKVPGLSIYMSVNKNGNALLKTLYARGIMTEDGKKQRLLYSPPMNMKKSDSSFLYYTANYKPEIISSDRNHVLWNFDQMPVSFYLDSTSAKSIYGRVQFPVEHILNKLVQTDQP